MTTIKQVYAYEGVANSVQLPEASLGVGRVAKKCWLNRNLAGMGAASFLSDLGHEMATAILPGFLVSIGASPAALGTIEGVADAVSSFVKVGAGYASDKTGIQKPIAVFGYTLTGLAKGSFALATSWLHVLAGRVVGWFGRGIRNPIRDAMLAASVEPESYGRAFGFHRAMDTAGAVLGPLVAVLLLKTFSFRQIFLVTLIPGLLSAVAFATLVKVTANGPNHHLRFWRSLRDLPKRYKGFLAAVGIFGIGDFAHTLLILRAMQMLAPSLGTAKAGHVAILLYVFHNVLYAVTAFPLGALGDRVSKRILLAVAYLISAAMGVGLVFPLTSFGYLALLFALGGIFIAMEDALEAAIAAELLPPKLRGTGYGVLATVNGVGDFVSSIVVGALWVHLSPAAGFGYAAVLSVVGSVILLRGK